MRYGDRTTLKRSFVIQKRVLGALLMREIITRYGRQNLGFLWLFVEPLMMTALIVLVWGGLRFDQHSTLNIIAFMATGYPLMMMWRNTANRAIGSVSSNLSLLYHRNVRVLDTIFARMILEIAGATIAQMVLMAGLILLGLIPFPHDLFYMLLAWSLMAMFAVGLGLIICSIAQYFEPFSKLWGTLSFLLMPLSGAFFFVHNMPPEAQTYLLKVPMIHGSEMFRHGYFGDTVTTYESPMYLLLVNLVLLWIGLVLVRRFSEGIEPR
ncbi:MAG: ABC transporter permease [Pasteurella oralis]|uniref:ABC transporter permease n=1 Tax=Pasteurella oralis TaxID=1071947 RepID=UPI0027023789|nr:ABC transporter permease [Pasteurella oralis]